MEFAVEIRDYESGFIEDQLTPSRIEDAIQGLLDRDGSDGIVIVTALQTETD